MDRDASTINLVLFVTDFYAIYSLKVYFKQEEIY